MSPSALHMPSESEAAPMANVAVFADFTDVDFILDTLGHIQGHEQAVIVSEDPNFLRRVKPVMRASSSEIGLDQDQISGDDIRRFLGQWLDALSGEICVLVDMSWLSHKVQGVENVEAWGALAEQIAGITRMSVVSLYNRELLIEEQVQVAFRAHRQFAARTGVYDNPFWVPPELVQAPLGEQLSFVLGRVVPDYADQGFFERDDRFAARGADPDWLAQPRKMAVTPKKSEGWKIYCLGQLRVYRNGNERIEWKIKGGAPKKARTLFAYLLSQGERGAHADRIAELLWPDSGTEENKRARLHHTVAMLRKTLGQSDSILRTGDFYRLNAPEGSWIDITTFEQLCRRGVSLFRRGQREEAQEIYATAEKLYLGDLFEDIPLAYVENELEDWCLPRRIWLREMALKLQRDFSVLLREQGKLRNALEHCQKALQIDPTSDEANVETMRVFHAQGRIDTVGRQYRQYKKAMETIGATPEGSEVQAVFLALTRR